MRDVGFRADPIDNKTIIFPPGFSPHALTEVMPPPGEASRLPGAPFIVHLPEFVDLLHDLGAEILLDSLSVDPLVGVGSEYGSDVVTAHDYTSLSHRWSRWTGARDVKVPPTL
jgi:hypothetical protein